MSPPEQSYWCLRFISDDLAFLKYKTSGSHFINNFIVSTKIKKKITNKIIIYIYKLLSSRFLSSQYKVGIFNYGDIRRLESTILVLLTLTVGVILNLFDLNIMYNEDVTARLDSFIFVKTEFYLTFCRDQDAKQAWYTAIMCSKPQIPTLSWLGMCVRKYQTFQL